ncbi:unnamed protein product [Paramecium pentaurelia]|uniref:Peptidase M14 domain-containing protein n=1 Tax=Paramecium pentaurelia TaxID=43138 RepID=A0A8S1XHM4_9CILI|nr:unnamed protein product [Paramecium pentaurelia]
MLNQDADLNKQPFHNQIPKPIALIDETISLENDMLLGWAPKLDYSKLLTLNFNNQLNDQIMSEALQNNQLVYVGFRPQDNHQMHKQYSTTSSYPFKKSKAIQNKPQYPFLGMNPTFNSKIQFNSIFESGNLDLVTQVSEFEYNLYMRVDGNTQGHTSWYNFELNGMKKGEKIQLNICNFTKSHSLYERGMKPYIWRSTNQEWLQGGENVQYRTSQNNNNCLSFCIICNQDNELIKIAYCVPYTYSQLLEYCDNLQKNCNHVKCSILCESLGGVQLPMFTFSKYKNKNKKCIIIQARIHPGESNGSWVMQGVMDYLSSQSAIKILEKCIIKVIPMMNPDGVILGNYRTGLAGKDLNRKFKQTDGILFPTVQAMKKLVKDQYKKFGNNLIAFIDLHGHSIKKNVFLYGPEYALWNYNYYKCRILPKLLSQKTEMFRFYSSIFRISQSKKSTARGVFADLYDIVNCFTIETSNGNYYTQTQTFEFNTKNWLKMGWIIGETLIDMIDTQNEMDQIYNSKNEDLKRSNRFTKNNSILNKKSITDPCQISFQNTKFQKLIEQLKMDADKMNQSCSEGNSDSFDDGDEIEEDTNENKSEEINKSKSIQSKPLLSILYQTQKSKLESKCSPTYQKPLLQQTIMLSIEHNQNKVYQPYQSAAQRMILKKMASRSQSKKLNQVNNYLTNCINQKQFATIEYLDNSLNVNQTMEQNPHSLIPRPSTTQLEVMEDEKFTPFQGLNTSLYSGFKRHTRLRSNLTAQKQKQLREIKRNNQTKSPPQITTNVRNTIMNNTQTNFEAMKLKLKMRLQQEPTKLSESYNTTRPSVPPSFYSVRRNMIKRPKI